jgi:hypothetical protein
VRLYTRVLAYLWLLAIPYPGLGSGPDQALDVTFDTSQRVNRLWGIPFLGFYARVLCLIPSRFVLGFVGLSAFVVGLVTWIPVLIKGRYPGVGYDVVGGFLRWTARYYGWFFMLVGPYPPFRLDD